MTAQNWPDPKRPGVPMFPERDGLHVVLGPFDTSPQLLLWQSTNRTYLKGEVMFAPEELMEGAILYHGPVLTPTQINEMLAAERERCAVIADAKRDAVWDGKIGSLANDKLRTGYAQSAITIGEAIRNLGSAHEDERGTGIRSSMRLIQ